MKTKRLTIRNPWNELDMWADNMSRVINSAAPTNRAGFWPAVNVAESADELVLTAEIPGINSDDIELTVENNTLTLSGDRTIVREENTELRYHVWERSSGSFKRSFTLPSTVRTEDIAADYENGVLTVRIPKAAEAKSRRIEIGAIAQA